MGIDGLSAADLEQMTQVAEFMLRNVNDLPDELKTRISNASPDLITFTTARLPEFERELQIQIHKACWVGNGKFRTPAKDAAWKRAVTAPRKIVISEEQALKKSKSMMGNKHCNRKPLPRTLTIAHRIKLGDRLVDLAREFNLSEVRIRAIKKQYVVKNRPEVP